MRSSAPTRLGWLTLAACAVLAVVSLVVWRGREERVEPVEAPPLQPAMPREAVGDGDRDREEAPVIVDASESAPGDAAPRASPSARDSDGLPRRVHLLPDTSEQRLRALTEQKERYQTLEGIQQCAAAYAAATYAVATILDHQGRTAPADAGGVVGPDEWEVMALEARYVFPKTEFVAYTEARSLYVNALGPVGARARHVPAAPPPTLFAELEVSLDALVGRATDLLTNED